MDHEFVARVVVLLGAILFVMMMGFAMSGGYDPPRCSRCREPFPPPPGGFTSTDAGGSFCRRCTFETGRVPWYWKPCLGKWDGKS